MIYNFNTAAQEVNAIEVPEGDAELS